MAHASFPNNPTARLLLVLFTALIVAFLGYFQWRDGRPPTYDDAWYLETSLRMYNALSEANLLSFLYEYCGAFGGSKAPLISVMPLPFFFLFGKQIDPTFWVNGLFLVLSSFYLYGLACRWYSPVVGLLAVVVYQTFPVVVGLSRVYMTDLGLVTLVLAFLYYLSISQDLRSGALNLVLGVLLGLGLLMKILFPAFVAGPLLAAWINRRRQDFAASEPFRGNLWGRAQSLAARYPLWSTGLAGGLVASSWYALNLVRVFTFAWNNAFGTIGDDYKAPGFGLWLLALPREGVSYYYALALLALVPAGCAILWRRRGMHWETRHTLMLAWFVPAAVALLIARSDSVRFAMPILPVAAIALARAMDVVSGALSRQAWVRAMLVTALLVLPLLGFTRTTFGGPSFANSLYPESYWFRPPDQQGQWNQLRIFEALHRLAPDPHRDYYVVVGVEHVYLNANLLNYYRVREGGPFAFMTFGYAQTSAEQAVNLINERQARFIVMAEGFQDGELPAFLNAVNGEIRDLLDQNKLPFRYRETVRLTDRLAVRFYERVEGSRAPGGGD